MLSVGKKGKLEEVSRKINMSEALAYSAIQG